MSCGNDETIFFTDTVKVKLKNIAGKTVSFMLISKFKKWEENWLKDNADAMETVEYLSHLKNKQIDSLVNELFADGLELTADQENSVFEYLYAQTHESSLPNRLGKCKSNFFESIFARRKPVRKLQGFNNNKTVAIAPNNERVPHKSAENPKLKRYFPVDGSEPYEPFEPYEAPRQQHMQMQSHPLQMPLPVPMQMGPYGRGQLNGQPFYFGWNIAPHGMMNQQAVYVPFQPGYAPLHSGYVPPPLPPPPPPPPYDANPQSYNAPSNNNKTNQNRVNSSDPHNAQDTAERPLKRAHATESNKVQQKEQPIFANNNVSSNNSPDDLCTKRTSTATSQSILTNPSESSCTSTTDGPDAQPIVLVTTETSAQRVPHKNASKKDRIKELFGASDDSDVEIMDPIEGKYVSCNIAGDQIFWGFEETFFTCYVLRMNGIFLVLLTTVAGASIFKFSVFIQFSG